MGRGLLGLLLFAASACAGAPAPAVREHAGQGRDTALRTARELPARPVAPVSSVARTVVVDEVTVTSGAHPLDAVRGTELERLVRMSPAKIGSASVGSPSHGALFNGAELPASPLWHVVRAERAWATQETVVSLTRAIETVNRRFPNTPTLHIGDLSRRRGGYLRPHRSHQSGRDADVGYYYLDGAAWYRRATAANLDCARTWALLEALIEGGDVEYVFVDRSVQKLLREHAETAGEDAAWLDEVFAGPRTGIVRHAWGHQTHLHVRFYNDRAERTGRLSKATLMRLRKI